METLKLLPEILELVMEEDDEIGRGAEKMLKGLLNGNKVCLLNKSSYELEQTGIRWYFK